MICSFPGVGMLAVRSFCWKSTRALFEGGRRKHVGFFSDRVKLIKRTRQNLLLRCWSYSIPSQLLKVRLVDHQKARKRFLTMSCTQLGPSGGLLPVWDFPFLTDANTVQYIATQMQVLFLIHCIPTKGRSSLVQTIAECYKGSSICCGPSPDWKYQLKECFEKEVGVIIVNDTNSATAHLHAYFSLAHKNNYTTIVVQPDCASISKDTCSPVQPMEQSAIRFDQEDSSMKIIYPFFYGWFLGRTVSLDTQKIGKGLFGECIREPRFVKIFKKHAISGSPKTASGDLDLDHYFSLDGFITGTTLLHCTSFYSNYGKEAGSQKYATEPAVLQSTGRAYDLKIIGFIITPRTFGVRLELSPAELLLWPEKDSGVKDIGVKSKSDPKLEELTADGGKKDEIPCPKKWHPTKFSPTCGVGSQAHLTLGAGKGIEAYQTGYDLDAIIQKELAAVEDKDFVLSFPLESGALRYYGDGEWAVYLDKPLEVKALFSGWY